MSGESLYMSFIHSSLKNTSQTWASISLSLSLSCRLSMFLSGTDLWLAAVSLPGTLFRNTTSPWVPPRWHWRWPTVGTALAECVPPFVAQRTGWSWHRLALLSQPSSPPMPWSQLASFHQTSDRPPAPACPRMSCNTGADSASYRPVCSATTAQYALRFLGLGDMANNIISRFF